MNTRPRRLPLVIRHWSFVIAASAAFASTDDALRPVAFQTGVNQQTLGAETAELARTINSLIDELQRNGFPLQSLAALTELAGQLNTLGDTDMSAIAARLRRLGESAQTDPRATATEAYVAQQAIETRLKTLARRLAIQQLREETARRLEALIARQLVIQRETRAIASAAADARRQRLLENDQGGIGDDLATFFGTGETLLARLREESPDTAAGDTFAERINSAYLTTLSKEALDQLKGKRYPDAYSRQEALVIELRKILQGILSSLPREQRLSGALQQVSALLQQQQASQQASTPPPPESRQQAADQAQNLADQVAPLSPEAAAALRQAQQALQNPGATPPQPQAPGARQQNRPDQQTAGRQNQAAPQPPGLQDPQQQASGRQQEQTPDAATAALAQAREALQNALAQARQQDEQGQNRQAGNQQQQGQQQNRRDPQQTAPNRQQDQARQTAQTGHDGQPPRPDQQNNSSEESYGDTQGRIAGHGPDAAGPAQVVGALRVEEREAFTVLQNERYPAEYSAWIQQYWRNLTQDQ